jgi:hypothetical protein
MRGRPGEGRGRVVQRKNVFGIKTSVSQERSVTLPSLFLISTLRGSEQDRFTPRIIDYLLDIFEKISPCLQFSRAYIALFFRKRSMKLFEPRNLWPQYLQNLPSSSHVQDCRQLIILP